MNTIGSSDTAVAAPGAVHAGTTAALRPQTKATDARTSPPPPVAADRFADPDRHGLGPARERLADELRRALAAGEVSLRLDEESHIYVIEVRDPRDGRLIRQVPPEELVRLHARLQELVKESGLLVDNVS